MANKVPFWTRSHLFVQVHSGTGTPYAIRINTKKLVGLISLLSTGFVAAIIGTLLFFRELEMNRVLHDKVLTFETRDKIAEQLKTSPRMVATNVVATNIDKATPTPKDATALKETAELTTDDPSEETDSDLGIGATEDKAQKLNTVPARIADLNSQCFEETCTVKVTMMPNTPGMAQGELLIVLETEIPRIGTANPTSNIRKRYFIYPGYQTVDELDQEKLHRMARKSYRFSRALVTTAEFTIGKLLRPFGVNIYLFDKAGNSVHHERREIASGE